MCVNSGSSSSAPPPTPAESDRRPKRDKNTNVLLYLCRYDLRVADNSILDSVKAKGGLKSKYTHFIPIYVYNARQIEVSGLVDRNSSEPNPYPPARNQLSNFWKCGPHRVRFIVDCVKCFQNNLQSLGSGLAIRVGKPADVLDHMIQGLQNQGHTVAAFWYTPEVGRDESQDEIELSKVCRERGVEQMAVKTVRSLIDYTAFDRTEPLYEMPGEFADDFRKRLVCLRTQASRRPLVDTPEKNSLPPFLEPPPQKAPFVIPGSPEELKTALTEPLGDLSEFVDPVPTGNPPAPRFPGGEDAGRRRLEFLFRPGNTKIIDELHDKRNNLTEYEFSTLLSPYLSQGCLTAGQVNKRLHEYEDRIYVPKPKEDESTLSQSVKDKRRRDEERDNLEDEETKGTHCLRVELLWRDHFHRYGRALGSSLYNRRGIYSVLLPDGHPATNKWNSLKKCREPTVWRAPVAAESAADQGIEPANQEANPADQEGPASETVDPADQAVDPANEEAGPANQQADPADQEVDTANQPANPESKEVDSVNQAENSVEGSANQAADSANHAEDSANQVDGSAEHAEDSAEEAEGSANHAEDSASQVDGSAEQAEVWVIQAVEPAYIATTLRRIWSGTTGMSLIDASQREVRQVGYTPSRARINLASFFCRLLRIDWRYGAEWYEMTLVDFDACSNWGSWQYYAGVGHDPRGNDRIYNPVQQALDHDKRGPYVCACMRELRGIRTDDHLFQPWTLSEAEARNLGLDTNQIHSDPVCRIHLNNRAWEGDWRGGTFGSNPKKPRTNRGKTNGQKSQQQQQSSETQVSPNAAQQNTTQQSMTQQNMAQHNMAQQNMTQQNMAQQSMTLQSMVQQGMVPEFQPLVPQHPNDMDLNMIHQQYGYQTNPSQPHTYLIPLNNIPVIQNYRWMYLNGPPMHYGNTFFATGLMNPDRRPVFVRDLPSPYLRTVFANETVNPHGQYVYYNYPGDPNELPHSSQGHLQEEQQGVQMQPQALANGQAVASHGPLRWVPAIRSWEPLYSNGQAIPNGAPDSSQIFHQHQQQGLQMQRPPPDYDQGAAEQVIPPVGPVTAPDRTALRPDVAEYQDHPRGSSAQPTVNGTEMQGEQTQTERGSQHTPNGTSSVGETGAGSAQPPPNSEQNTPDGTEEQDKGKDPDVDTQNATNGTSRRDKGKGKAV